MNNKFIKVSYDDFDKLKSTVNDLWKDMDNLSTNSIDCLKKLDVLVEKIVLDDHDRNIKNKERER